MAIIKVASSIFSTVRTIAKALRVAKTGDVIQLSDGKYNESIEIEGTVTIEGTGKQLTTFEGTLIIHDGATVIIENMTLQPTATIQVNGAAFFNHCTITGKSAILVQVKGTLDIKDCAIYGAKEVGIDVYPEAQCNATALIMHHNGKVNILANNASVELHHCILHSANHGVWLKNDSSLMMTSCKIRHHSGTQLIAHQQSTIFDKGSCITHGQGNGLYASANAEVTLVGSKIDDHVLPQIWMQNAHLKARNISILNGLESGIMLRDHATAEIYDAELLHHKLAHLQVTLSSHAHVTTSQFMYSEGNALQIKEKSSVNIIESKISHSQLSQCHVSEKSVLNIYESTVNTGEQAGLFFERGSTAYIIQSFISHHASSAVSAVESDVYVTSSEIFNNTGNAVLLLNSSKVLAEDSVFMNNQMPHFAGKTATHMTLRNSELCNGKSVYALDYSTVTIEDCHIHNSEGIQLEIQDNTKMTIHNTVIAAGQSNGLKASKSSFVEIDNCQISEHRHPQLVLDDSQLILRNSELHSGQENGIILENDAEALIEDTFISKHQFPQLWVNHNSTVELRSVHFTEGMESDIYACNHSSIEVHKSYIHNERFNYNIQALNHSSIELHSTIARNTCGEMFYIENNSSITTDVEEH